MISLEEWQEFLDHDYDFSFMQEDDVQEHKKEAAKVACEHKWVDVGFMHSKIVCKVCDIEKAVFEKQQTSFSYNSQHDTDCD